MNDLMEGYMDDLYICPECNTEHKATAWTEATLNDCEGPVMPLEIADDGDYLYTCPTCWEVVENKNLLRPINVEV